MRFRFFHLFVASVLMGAATLHAQDQDKKVNFYYPEDFLACTGVDSATGLFQNAQDTFNVIRDESVTVWLSLKYIPKEKRTVKFVWYSPRGDKYAESKTITINQEEFFRKYARAWQQIGIRDLDKLGLLGQWRVVALVDGKPVDKEAKFTLVR